MTQTQQHPDEVTKPRKGVTRMHRMTDAQALYGK